MANLRALYDTKVRNLIASAMRDAVVQLRRELRAQGHIYTGKLIKSIDFKIEEKLGNYTFYLIAEDYWQALNSGTRPFNVFKSSGSNPFGKSSYINALYNWFISKLGNQKEALKATFATARITAKKGIPTRSANAKSFSSNGRRLGFANLVLGKEFGKIEAKLERGMNRIALELFDITIEELRDDFNRIS